MSIVLDFGIIYVELAEIQLLLRMDFVFKMIIFFVLTSFVPCCYLCMISLFGKFMQEVYLAILDGTKALRRLSANFASLP